MASNSSPEALTSFPGFRHPTRFPLPLKSAISKTTTPLSKSILTPTLTSAEVAYTPLLTRSESESESDNSNPWNHLSEVSHRVVIAVAIIGMVIAICVCLWFLRERRKRAQASPNGVQPGALPLYNLQTTPAISRFTGGGGPPRNTDTRAPRGDAPPPRYEEVVPLHLRVVTGPPIIVHGAEDGMVADGKTPLSEIPFEDVVLEPSSSSSSTNTANQAFNAVHHNGVGDTRGHTNA